MDPKDKLQPLRKKLDEIDQQIVSRLAERQTVVRDVAALKRDDRTPLRDRKREEEILARLSTLGEQAGVDGYYVSNVFRQILDYSVRAQQAALTREQNPFLILDRPTVVGYQGGPGAYSHIAARSHVASWDGEYDFLGYASFSEMLEAVRVGSCDFALLPIENTTAGSINEAYDLLAEMDLFLIGEEIQRVEHCLVALDGVELSDIQTVLSHSQALTQCRRFLSSLGNCAFEAFGDTALAVDEVKRRNSKHAAAIASEEAARIRGLKPLRSGIADQAKNYTRMVVAASESVSFDLRIPCKTSLVFSTRHEDGALLNVLQILANHGLNLTKLESRPRKNTPWEYTFYVDFQGNIKDAKVFDAVERVREKSTFLKVLGSYPARTIED